MSSCTVSQVDAELEPAKSLLRAIGINRFGQVMIETGFQGTPPILFMVDLGIFHNNWISSQKLLSESINFFPHWKVFPLICFLLFRCGFSAMLSIEACHGARQLEEESGKRIAFAVLG